jgi:hypothetical protein
MKKIGTNLNKRSSRSKLRGRGRFPGSDALDFASGWPVFFRAGRFFF